MEDMSKIGIQLTSSVPLQIGCDNKQRPGPAARQFLGGLNNATPSDIVAKTGVGVNTNIAPPAKTNPNTFTVGTQLLLSHRGQ